MQLIPGVSSPDGNCVDDRLEGNPLGLSCLQPPRIPSIKLTFNTTPSLPQDILSRSRIVGSTGAWTG